MAVFLQLWCYCFNLSFRCHPKLQSIAKTKSPSIFVRRLEENDIKLVAVSRIQLLGMNKVDRQRAEKTEGIQRAYNMAVAMLRGDV